MGFQMNVIEPVGGGKRETYLDILRFLATFAVIVEHVAAEGYRMHQIGTNGWYMAVVADSLVRWCVPVFVMISGALFLNPQKVISTNGIITKYVRRLFIAYCFWYIAYVCMYITIESIKAHALVINGDFFKPQFHLWFLPMLMGVYLLVPLLRVIASSKKLLKYSIALWLIYITVSFCIEWEIPQFSKLFVMNIVIGYAGYYLLGYYLSCIDYKRKYLYIICFLGIIGIFVKAIGNIFLSVKYGIPDNKFLFELGPHVALTATSVFVILKSIDNNKYNKKFLFFIDNNRKDLFGVYLIHGVWLYLFIRYYDLSTPLVTIPILSLLIYLFSVFTSKLMRKSRLLKIVVE